MILYSVNYHIIFNIVMKLLLMTFEFENWECIHRPFILYLFQSYSNVIPFVILNIYFKNISI